VSRAAASSEIVHANAMLAGTMTPTRRAVLALYTVLAIAASAALPAVASAELSTGGAIQEQVTKAQQQEESAATTTTTATGEKKETETSSSSLPSTLVLLGVGTAIVLLGGIAFVIVRDARSVAPVTDGSPAAGGDPRSAEARLRRRRAKAKAARQQRKRNR
jgi:hypothetical protein